MEEKHVHEVVVAVDVEVHLPAYERESRTQFPECFGDPIRKGIFQIPFGDFP